MVKHSASRLVEQQRDTLKDLLRPFFGPGTPYVLLDFPDHPNVGDSAIWCGEIALLVGLTGQQPLLAARADGFRPAMLDDVPDDSVICIHGGGNFGDIWPGSQRFRESILAAFPDRTIVQLPQTIHFSDSEAIARAAKVIGGTSDFHLFVRDHASREFAESQLGCAATLAPDCAMGMGPLARPCTPEIDLLWLLRTDLERAATTQSAPGPGAIVEDWLEEPPLPRNRLRNGALLDTLKSVSISRELTRAHLLNRIAAHRVERGLRQLSRARQVVTDRLHAHILSTMMGLPHVILDNSYGKVSGYRNTWHADAELARFAETAGEVPGALRALDTALLETT